MKHAIAILAVLALTSAPALAADDSKVKGLWMPAKPLVGKPLRAKADVGFGEIPGYAHQGGSNPPIVVIHGNSLDQIGDNYKRYLEGWFRNAFKLGGTPLRIELRTQGNPYDENRKAPVRKRTLGHSKSAPRVKTGGKSKNKFRQKSSGRKRA